MAATVQDAGYYLRAWVTIAGPGGSVGTWATGAIGPIRSQTAGAAVLHPGAVTIRGSAGRPLARASASWALVRAHQAGSSAHAAAVQAIRVGAIRGKLRAWVCVLDRAAPTWCAAPMTVRRAATFSLALRSGERAELVAIAPN
jgi:hypothetical protein